MSRLTRGFSGVLAVVGIALYVVSGSDWAWWSGLAMVMPFAVLAFRRASEGRGRRTFESSGDGGVWGPP